MRQENVQRQGRREMGETVMVIEDWQIDGRPCVVHVLSVVRRGGSFSLSAETDLDFYGWSEVTYRVVYDPENEGPQRLSAYEDGLIVRRVLDEYDD